jgi:hypothetical protein
MKKIKTLSISIMLLLVIGSSCSLEKRIHRTGYHIDWPNNNARIPHKEVTVQHQVKNLNTLSAIDKHRFHETQPRSFKTLSLTAESRKENRLDQSKIQSNTSTIATTKNTEKEKENEVIRKDRKKEHKPKPRKDLWAIAGFVLSFLGPISIFGIIASLISLYRIKKNPKLGGKGLALAGLIIGIAVALTVIFILLSTWGVF